jgi:hypothetical protein
VRYLVSLANAGATSDAGGPFYVILALADKLNAEKPSLWLAGGGAAGDWTAENTRCGAYIAKPPPVPAA